MTEKLCTFAEPINGVECELWLIDFKELENSEYQRAFSKNLSNKLSASVLRGFFMPLIVIWEDGAWKIIDGQHRKAAVLKAKGAEAIPAIKVPSRFKYYTLLYNIEKADAIKDRCMKAHKLYTDFTDLFPEKNEGDLREYVNNEPHLITLAFAYMEHDLKSPSLLETSLKKFDHFVDNLSLPKAIETRKHRGHLASVLESTVYDAANNAGFSDFILKQAIVSKTNKQLWEGKRSLDVAFDDGVEQMIDFIESKDWSFLGR